MKRRYRKRTFLLLLTIASFLLLNSCGLPTYLLVPDNEVSFSTTESSTNTYEIRVKITDTVFNELDDKKTTPSVKLFYAYSTSNTEAGNQVLGSEIQLSSVKSTFNSIYKNGYRGVVFSPTSTNAAALYFYKKPDTSLKTQISRFDNYDTSQDIDAMLLGTFSIRTTDTQDDENFDFEATSTMDFPIPLSEFPIGNREATFSLAFDTSKSFTSLKLTTPNESDYFLGDYKKQRFLGNTSTTQVFKESLTNQDKETFEAIIDGIDNTLYIHIWASLFGGEGDFNNIVWSNLQYIGAIQLL